MQVIVIVPYVCTVETLSTIYRQKDNNHRTVFTVRFPYLFCSYGIQLNFCLFLFKYDVGKAKESH